MRIRVQVPGIPSAVLASRALLLALVVTGLSAAFAPACRAQAIGHGRVLGKVLASDTGAPVGFADVLLIPADSTQGRRSGGLANADGSFVLEALPGTYALQVRAISYARKLVTGIVVTAGALKDISVSISTEALQQEEVVVEAKAITSTDAALLSARKRATSVGDAVGAEQVKRSPDKNAAEVLRRVTGVSVSQGKYVFVRGLGERYSSTELDGVRIASPEQNKRVVPLDLLPANLLDNIVVQKTYTADRPGEFGGGDVQVHTKDFPGRRSWQISTAQGYASDVTFRDHLGYRATGSDVFGFGAGSRALPDAVTDVAGASKLTLGTPPRGFSRGTLANVARAFDDIWSPTGSKAAPNGSYALTYGDEFKVFGHPLGLIQSWSLNRSYDQQREAQRFYPSPADTLYDYDVRTSTASIQLGGLAGVSYRLSTRGSIHLRGFYTKSADDEVRTYEGPDHNRVEAMTGTYLVHRDTRLMYVERSILSGAVEGQHEFAHLRGLGLDWKLSRSGAKRSQPDRREITYDRYYYDDGTGNLVSYWAAGSAGLREYGDLKDTGWGSTASLTMPYRIAALGAGKIAAGFDRQSKRRQSNYRRFAFYRRADADPTAPPESLYAPNAFDSTMDGAYVDETTLNPQDNYGAAQLVTAGYLSIDVPMGRRLRGNVGVRIEDGSQDVRSYDLFDPSRVIRGGFRSTDWLGSGNFTWSLSDLVNLRAAASRTISRPDLNELSPRPSLEYVGGFQQSGNPDLHRAQIDNYDLRAEAFPTLSEVFALGLFYKRLHEPIEQTIQGGAPPILIPRNSDRGRNFGIELEARLALGRVLPRLSRFALNANATFISSAVQLKPQISLTGSQRHPLQGQANYLVNGALTYMAKDGRLETAVLLTATGRRLDALGLRPLPDTYEEPTLFLDTTTSFSPMRNARIKLAARNLLDPKLRRLQAGKEVSSYRVGRSFTVALAYGE